MDENGLIALSRVKFTQDGELVAYSISKKGSDWNTIKVWDFRLNFENIGINFLF